MAAALGAGMDLKNPNGHMIVDIGGGTTDIAVLSMNAVATSSSIEVAGDAFDEAIARFARLPPDKPGDAVDEAIARFVRRKTGIIIGQTTAEEIKIQIGCVYPRPEDSSMIVRGRDAKTGMPRETTLLSSEIFDVLRRPARQIADEVQTVLEDTAPELVSDLAVNGITLTGGGSQLWGMSQMLTERTGVACTLADDPDSCVAYGCGKSLAWMNHMQEGPINIARRRAMQSRD